MIDEHIFIKGMHRLSQLYTVPKQEVLNFYHSTLNKYLDDNLFITSCQRIILTRKYKSFPALPEFLEAVGKQPNFRVKVTRGGATRVFLGKDKNGILHFQDELLHMSLNEKKMVLDEWKIKYEANFDSPEEQHRKALKKWIKKGESELEFPF